MKLPEKYSHLNYEQKKVFIEKVINLYGDKKIKNLINNKEFGKENVEFLFSYIFSDKEQRREAQNELVKRFNKSKNLLEGYIHKLSMLNNEANEFKSDLKEKEDIESLENQILSS